MVGRQSAVLRRLRLNSLRGGGDAAVHLPEGVVELEAKIKEHGNKVREMKERMKTDPMAHTKEELDAEIQQLKALKLQLSPSAPPKPKQKTESTASQKQKSTKEGITISKAENFAGWYPEVLMKAELIDYYDVGGCYILRPWAYSIWERIQASLDSQIKGIGAENCYFPMFVSQAALMSEQEHVEGFTPEVAWVTRAGSSDLAQPVAIR
eukprot:914561-Rhodomonas_salina.1